MHFARIPSLLVITALVLAAPALAQLTPDPIGVFRTGPENTSAASLEFKVDFEYWPYNGLDVTDFAPTAAGATVSAVHKGKAFLFGSAGRIETPPLNNAPTTTITFECWLRTTDANGIIMGYAQTSAPGIRFLDPGNLTLTANNQADVLVSGHDVADGQWHHVAARWASGGNMSIVVDGVVVALSPTASGALPGGGSFFALRDLSGADPLIADIDEVRLWDVARTTGNINSFLDRSVNGNNNDLIVAMNIEGLEDLGVGAGGTNDVRDVGQWGNHGEVTGNLPSVEYTQIVSNVVAWVEVTPPANCSGPVGLDVLNDGTITGFDGTPQSAAFSGGETYQFATTPLTIHVPGDEPTIQDAIDAAPCDGTIILLAPGTYLEHGITFGGKDIVVRGDQGPANTIVDAQGLDRAFIVDAGVLEGITVRNGSSGTGGGAYVTGGATIRDCVFEDNDASSQGGGLGLWGNCSVERCVFRGNTSGSAGGAIASFIANTTKTVVNCAFIGNSCSGQGGGIYQSSSSTLAIRHCTFLDNTAGSGGQAVHDPLGAGFSSTVTLDNSIAWGPGNQANGTVVVSFSNVQGGHTGIGNIDTQPYFADEDGRLLPCSPCLDAGDPAPSWTLPTTDMDGNPRVLDAAPDMGAFETAIAPYDPYPGTGEDFTLDVTVNGAGSSCPAIQEAAAGDLVGLHFASPGGTFDGSIPIVVGQPFTTGTPPVGSFPGLQFNVAAIPAPFVIFDGTVLGGLMGPLTLPAGGMTIQGTVPPSFTGTSVMLQALALGGPAANTFFAASSGRELRIP